VVVLAQRSPLVLPQPHGRVWGRVNCHFKRDPGLDSMQPPYGSLKHPREIRHRQGRARFESVMVVQGEYPSLEGAAGSVGGIDKEMGGFAHQPQALAALLVADVAVQTALFVGKVLTRGGQFLAEVIEDNWRPENPGEGVGNAGRRRAFLAEHKNSPDLGIPVQISDPFPIHPQDALDIPDRQAIPRGPVVRRLDDDLAGPPTRDLVEDPKPFPLDVTLNLQDGGTFRDHPNEPFRAVCGLAVGPVSGDLRRGF